MRTTTRPTRRPTRAAALATFRAELDRRAAANLAQARTRIEAGDPAGLYDAALCALLEHTRRTHRVGQALDSDSAELVPVPAWLLGATMGLVRLVLADPPKGLTKHGRRARRSTDYQYRQRDLARYHAMEAHLAAGASRRAAKAGASAALADTPAQGAPNVIEQAWTRVRREPERFGATLGELMLFR